MVTHIALFAAGFAIAFLMRRPVTVVYEYQRALLYKKGKFVGVRGPGVYWRLSQNTHLTVIDTRLQTVTVPGQEVITADGVGIKISLSARYAVNDAEKAIHSCVDYTAEAYAVLQLALRDLVAAHPVDQLVSQRQTLGDGLLEKGAPQLEALGLSLTTVDIKDIMYAKDLKRAFSQVVRARQEGLAALEKARGEAAALRKLANAAQLVEDRPALMQLRALQSVSAEGGNTLVLGLGGQGDGLMQAAKSRRRGSEVEPAGGGDGGRGGRGAGGGKAIYT